MVRRATSSPPVPELPLWAGLIVLVAALGTTTFLVVRALNPEGFGHAAAPPPKNDAPVDMKGKPPDPKIQIPKLPDPDPKTKLPEPAPTAEPLNPHSLPGLIAYWPMDEGKGIHTKEALGGFPSTLWSAEWLQGVKGAAVRLGGGKAHVDLGFDPKLNFPAGAPFTMAGWVATEANQGVISSFRRRSTLFPIINVAVQKGQLQGFVRDDSSGSGAARVVGGKINDGQWHHFALLRYSDGTIELMLDGVSKGREKGASTAGPITTDLRGLGADRLQAGLGKKGTPSLVGVVDEFCIYNRALPVAEVSILAGKKN